MRPILTRARPPAADAAPPRQRRDGPDGTGETVLTVDGLSVELEVDRQRVPIVREASFSIARGELVALVGESGSGKTVTALSLMRLLARDLRVSGGRAIVAPPGKAGVDVAAPTTTEAQVRALRGNEIGMIFQEPMASFSPLLTIGAHITDVLRVHRRISKRQALRQAEAMLERVGIPDPARAVRQYPDEFSGGMRQRAMIARALICDPCLLIADEPTTALDVTIQAQILELIRDLQRQREMGVLFITHDLGIVAQIADKVAVMYAGRIVEYGRVREIFRRPRHPYTRGLLAAVPRLGGVGQRLVPVPGAVPGLFDMPAGCAFHPRCPAADTDRCPAQAPPLAESDGAHAVACWRPDCTPEREVTS